MKLHSIAKKIIARVVITGVVLLMAACSDGVHSSPKSVVETFIKVGADGNFDALKPLCASEAPEELCNPDTDDREEFVKIMGTAKIVGEPQIEGDKASVKMSIKSEDQTLEVSFPLAKQGDKWLLSGEPEEVDS